MSMHDLISSKRKGITPVIATVLLLGITVAIGLTVYTQAQGLIGDLGGGGGLQKVQDTSIKLTPVYSEGGQLQVRVTNTGDRAINSSKFSMFFGPPNFPNPVSYTQLPSDWKYDSDPDQSGVQPAGNQCLSASSTSQIIAQGDHIECLTGVRFPGALESVDVVVRANNFDYSKSKTCDVQNAGARSC